MDVALTVRGSWLPLILLSPKPQRKRTDTANVMDTTITKDDNSKTFRGHLKVFIKVDMFLFYQNVAYCVLLKRNAL